MISGDKNECVNAPKETSIEILELEERESSLFVYVVSHREPSVWKDEKKKSRDLGGVNKKSCPQDCREPRSGDETQW